MTDQNQPNQQTNQQPNQQMGQASTQQTNQTPGQTAGQQNGQAQAGYWQQPASNPNGQAAGQQAAPQPQQAQGYAPQQPVRQSDASLTLGTWVVTVLLSCIPIVGIIMLFIWGFDSTTAPARRNYARAMLIWKAVAIVILLVCGSALAVLIAQISGAYYDYDPYDMSYMMSTAMQMA